MAKAIMHLIDTDEVRVILRFYFADDEDRDAKVELLMGCVEDGSIEDYIYDTFGTRDFDNYWQCVEDAVTDWADDVLDRADNTDKE